VEPDSKYPHSLDGPVRIFGQAASEFVLNAPVVYADGSELSQSLILDMVVFLQEFLPAAGLRDVVSNEAVASVVRFTLMVFSIEYLEARPKEPTWLDIHRSSRDDIETTPRPSASIELERDNMSRTPPRTPLSPNVSGENFQARVLSPPQEQGLPDEQENPVVQQARAYLDAIWDQGYQGTIVDQMKIEVGGAFWKP